ncbi:MAG: ChbG/HpnK family deacetylase, partial [Planctomycetota bacterium]|nr:ChbG/HpnK family deacetylase [Planctomycetota bacterium]
ITLTGCMSRQRVLELVGNLGEGVTEMMVHPGYADFPEGFSGPDRETELEVLTDKELRRQIEEGGIELVRFRDL